MFSVKEIYEVYLELMDTSQSLTCKYKLEFKKLELLWLHMVFSPGPLYSSTIFLKKLQDKISWPSNLDSAEQPFLWIVSQLDSF